jgi:hypothetical protein
MTIPITFAYHIQNAAAIQACGEHAKPNLAKGDRVRHEPPDLTASVQTVVHCMLSYEARADIQGWNDMIAAAVHDHRNSPLHELIRAIETSGGAFVVR